MYFCMQLQKMKNKYFQYNKQNKTLLYGQYCDLGSPWPSDISLGPIGPQAISLALGLHKSRYYPERSVLFCNYYA